MTCDPNFLARQSSCLRCLTDAQLNQVRTFLLCRWASLVGGVAPSSPSNPDIAIFSGQNNVVVTWTNPTTPGSTNEVWKSTDGTTFALFATVGGSTSQKSDATGMAAGNIWYYKVRSCNGVSCSAFTSVVSASFNYTSPNVAAISFPTLVRAFGFFTASGLALLTSVSLPALKTVFGNLDLSNNPNLTSITLTNLSQVLNIFSFLGSSIVTASFPSLTSVTSIIFSSATTTTVNFPALSQATNIDGNSSALLTAVTLPVLIFTDGGVLDFSACGLLAATVNQVLARGVASGLVAYDFELNLGTNAAPSGQGVVDKATLIGQGNTVVTN